MAFSSVSPLNLTYKSTGQQDSVAFVGMGYGSNQWVNVNAGSYLDVSGTQGALYVPAPFSSGTITSFASFFKLANYTTPFMAFADHYTLTMALYYGPPPGSGTVIGTYPFYPVPGASVQVDLSSACSICIFGEAINGSVSGLSFSYSAGTSFMVLCTLSCPSVPTYPAGPLSGYVTASVGMQ